MSNTAIAPGEQRPRITPRLRDLLSAYPADRLVLRGDSDWTATRVRTILDSMAYRHVKDRGIALAIRSMPRLAMALAALDGTCESILLVSPDWEDTSWSGFLERARIDVLFADHAVPPNLTLTCRDVETLFQGPCEVAAGGVAAELKTRWILSTSGTTGTPKLVSHSWETLTRAIKTVQTTATRRWGLLYDLTRFAGLQVFLQALASQATLLFTDHLQTLDDRIAFLVANQCDALSATPTLWRRILMCPFSRDLPLRQVTLGGEIADQPVLTALAHAYPKARITHIYASTEAGVGFSVRDGKAGFPAAYLQEGFNGAEIAIDNSGMLLLRPPIRDQHFIGSSRLIQGDGWIRTGDLVEQRGDRCYFLGRASGAINVGGNKVCPEEVEHVILELPEVSLARVMARRSSIVGSLVEATVVPRDPGVDAERLKERVQAHCRSRLAAFKVPAFVTISTSLDTDAGGKLPRR